MRRREFIGLVGSAAAAWPLAVSAQQPERVRHVGMLTTLGADDPEAQTRIALFKQTLQELGWVVDRNLIIDIRQVGSDLDRAHTYATELAGASYSNPRLARMVLGHTRQETTDKYDHMFGLLNKAAVVQKTSTVDDDIELIE